MPLIKIPPSQPPYRELPGAFGRFVQFNRWITRTDVAPLRDDEFIQFEALSWFASGLQPRHRWQRWTNSMMPPTGTLRLTDHRLTWMPWSWRYLPRLAPLPIVDIELDEIAELDGSGGRVIHRILLPFIPRIRLVLRDGSSYLWAAYWGGTLRKKIAEVAGVQAADAPPAPKQDTA